MHSFVGRRPMQAAWQSSDCRQFPHHARPPIVVEVPTCVTKNERGKAESESLAQNSNGHQADISPNQALPQHPNVHGYPAQAQSASLPPATSDSTGHPYGTGQLSDRSYEPQNYPPYIPPATTKSSYPYGAPYLAQAQTQTSVPQMNAYHAGQIPDSGGAIPSYSMSNYSSYGQTAYSSQGQTTYSSYGQNTSSSYGQNTSSSYGQTTSSSYGQTAIPENSSSYDAPTATQEQVSIPSRTATQEWVSTPSWTAPHATAQLPQAEQMVSTHWAPNCPPSDHTFFTGGFSPRSTSTQLQSPPYANYSEKTWNFFTGSPSSDAYGASPTWSSQSEPSFSDYQVPSKSNAEYPANQTPSSALPVTLDSASVQTPQSSVLDNSLLPLPNSSNTSNPQNDAKPAAQKKVPYVPRAAHHFMFRASFLTRKPEAISFYSVVISGPAAPPFKHQASSPIMISDSEPDTNLQFFSQSQDLSSLSSESHAQSPKISQAFLSYFEQTAGEAAATGENAAAYQSPRDLAPVIQQVRPVLPSDASVSATEEFARNSESSVSLKSDNYQQGCRTSSSESAQDVNHLRQANCDDQTQIHLLDIQNSHTSTPIYEDVSPSLSYCASPSSVSENKDPILDVQQESEHSVSTGSTEQILTISSAAFCDSDTASCKRSEFTPDDSENVTCPPILERAGRKRRRSETPEGDKCRAIRRSSRSDRSSTASTSVSDSEAPESTERSLDRAVKCRKRRRNSTGGLTEDCTAVSSPQPLVPDVGDTTEESPPAVVIESTDQMDPAGVALKQRIDAALEESSEHELARAVADLLDCLGPDYSNPTAAERFAEPAEFPIQNAHLEHFEAVLSVNPSSGDNPLMEATA